MTNAELVAKYESLSAELKVARAAYAAISEANDYEPCPEAKVVRDEVVGRYNEVAKEMENRKLGPYNFDKIYQRVSV